VLAVRDNHKERSSSTTGATTAREQQQPEVGADGGASSGVGGGDAGEIVAIVELCLRQPDGWFPFNWLFLVRIGMLSSSFGCPKVMVDPGHSAPTRGGVCSWGSAFFLVYRRKRAGFRGLILVVALITKSAHRDEHAVRVRPVGEECGLLNRSRCRRKLEANPAKEEGNITRQEEGNNVQHNEKVANKKFRSRGGTAQD